MSSQLQVMCWAARGMFISIICCPCLYLTVDLASYSEGKHLLDVVVSPILRNLLTLFFRWLFTAASCSLNLLVMSQTHKTS